MICRLTFISIRTLDRTLTTDAKRLQQVLKNLLSNAFKFTAQGGVRLTVSATPGGWNANHPVLSQASSVVSFEVSDTGIGIPLEKQKMIFEAFQQADASTSRKYGGTGLGLAISRELATLLGGEIHLRSAPNSGIEFYAISADQIFRIDHRFALGDVERRADARNRGGTQYRTDTG